jgi:hypothetical protein
MKGIHKNKQLNINEMRTFLKYKIVASDIWKLLHEIMLFEENGLNPLVNAFLE